MRRSLPRRPRTITRSAMELLGCGMPLLDRKAARAHVATGERSGHARPAKERDAASRPRRAIQSGADGRGGRRSRSKIHRRHAHERLHVPLDRYRRRDGHHDPRSGYRPVAREIDSRGRAGAGHFGPRRPRRHGHGAADIRQRLRGQIYGLARQLPAEADDVDLHVARQRVDQFRDARSHGRETERRGAAARVPGRPAYRPTSGRIGKSMSSIELLVRTHAIRSR